MRVLLVAALLLSAACAPAVTTDEGGSAGGELETVRPQLPLLVNHGGPVLSAPEVYTVVWKGDEADGAVANRYYAAVMSTPAVWGVLTQYGVTGGVAKGVVVIPETPPASLDATDMPALIDRLLESGALPPASPQTVYAFIPANSTLATFKGMVACRANSCGQFGGYHESTPDGHVYSIVTRCGTSFDAAAAGSGAHELMETATDPMPSRNPAWLGADLSSEVADLCPAAGMPLVTPAHDQLAVYRPYSNAIAASGKGDPCGGAVPYANVDVPQVVDVRLDAAGNGSATIPMTAFADAGIKGVNWSVFGTVGCQSTATLTLRSTPDVEVTTQGALHGSSLVSVPTSFSVSVSGVPATDTSYDLGLSALAGASYQVRVVELRLVR